MKQSDKQQQLEQEEYYRKNLQLHEFSDLNDLDGLQFMPVAVKQPVVKGWQTLFKSIIL